MKRNLFFITIVFFAVIGLSACSGNKNTEANNSRLDDQPQNEEDTNIEDENDSDSVTDNDASNNSSANEVFKVQTEDQLDLGIGDTGRFDTTLGTYEITLNSAELVGDEYDNEPSQLDNLILLNITIKNTSSEALNLDDLISSLEITESLNGSGYGDGAEDFSSLEKLTGIIEPGESITGPFITDAYESDEYYFRENPGNVGAGLTNQVIWTFTAEEAK